jgi:hypothetical protein
MEETKANCMSIGVTVLNHCPRPWYWSQQHFLLMMSATMNVVVHEACFRNISHQKLGYYQILLCICTYFFIQTSNINTLTMTVDSLNIFSFLKTAKTDFLIINTATLVHFLHESRYAKSVSYLTWRMRENSCVSSRTRRFWGQYSPPPIATPTFRYCGVKSLL